MNNRILLVEDDQSFGAVLKDYLMMNNYEVTLATDGELGLKEFMENEFDIGIFDVMMPKKDGFSLAEDVKRINKNMPIIFLTAKNLREDILKGYQIGADDYITKPFNPRELTIRARNLLNRTMVEEKETISTSQNIEQYRFNGWTLDINSRSLITPEGEENKLPRSEFRALLHFCENPGKIQTREDLLLKMTGRKLKPHDRTVDVTIRRIRKHFEDHPTTPEIIVTIHGEGYRFCGELVCGELE